MSVPLPPRPNPAMFPPEFMMAMQGANPGAMQAAGGAPMPQMAGIQPLQPAAGPLAPGMPLGFGGHPPVGGNTDPQLEGAEQGLPPIPGQDPVLQALLGQAPQQSMVPRFGLDAEKLPKPDFGDILSASIADQTYWSGRNERISRDIMIYRQHESGVPIDFDEMDDTRFISAAMSNLVNRLANMMSGLEPHFESPFSDDETEKDSQAIENFGYWSRGIDRRLYAKSTGGNLQRDEFVFLLLHGAIAARVLPDVSDTHYPFTVSIVDPSTVYPTFGGPKEGLLRVTRVYTQTIARTIREYGGNNKALKDNLMAKFGSEAKNINEFVNQEIQIIEYYDQRYRAVYEYSGIEILPVKEHGYDFVPWVYITAVGEPSAMQTPHGKYVTVNNRGTWSRSVTVKEELREKGVSVLHYLVNTHRLKEAIYTLLYAEIEKASAPPTMRYRAPQLMKTDIPEIDYKRNGQNAAYLGLERVEGLPTSARPTDVAPTLQQLEQDIASGGLNPAAQAQEMGANVSGYAMDALVATAKELILPYLQAFENYLSLLMEMKLRFYHQVIGSLVSVRVPDHPLYGSANSMTVLTPDMIDRVGVALTVKMKNITDQNMGARAQTAQMLVQAGFYSQRAGMDYVGVQNPDLMFQQIFVEKALQHPLVMELFAIPGALESQGSRVLSNLWAQTVGMQALMQSGLGGTQPTQPGQGGPPAPPNQGGQSNTGSAGQMNSPAPGGPAPGQGRTS